MKIGLLFLILKASRLGCRLFDRALLSSGLSLTAYSFLSSLKNDFNGCCGYSDMAISQGISKSSMPRAIKPLLDAGFVDLQYKEGNGKERVIKITRYGEDAVARCDYIASKNYNVASYTRKMIEVEKTICSIIKSLEEVL